MTDAMMIHIACGAEAEAQKIADALVEQKLVACAQIFPIISTFSWKGNVEQEGEYLLQGKTLAKHFEAIDRAVRKLHSYETYELIAMPITSLNEDYKTWLNKTVA